MIRGLVAFMSALSLALAACGGEPSTGPESDGRRSFEQPFTNVEAYPVFASSEVVVGENRFLVGLLDDHDAPIGSPKIGMTINFYDLDRSVSSPVVTEDMGFIWIDKPYLGLYGGSIRFPSPGKWGAEVKVRGKGLNETVRASFEVKKESSTPGLGTRPPASDTPVAGDVGRLSEISTDDHPDPRFYELSIDEALEANKPFVVVFATPKFCVSQTCGPTLNVVKRVAGDFKAVNFIHVEPYELPADPSNLRPVQAAVDWGLPSEPWVFVVDSSGRVAAKYEGILGPGELRHELRRVS
jgi:hypothetical protein